MSQDTSAQRAKAQAILQKGRLVRLRDLMQAGVGPETMARLVRDGIAVRPARGLYQLADATPDARHTLAEAAALVPKGVICLNSALQFHELTLHMSSAVWMAIDRTGWKPRVDYPAIRFVRFNNDIGGNRMIFVMAHLQAGRGVHLTHSLNGPVDLLQ